VEDGAGLRVAAAIQHLEPIDELALREYMARLMGMREDDHLRRLDQKHG
jgi:hypothetical protein